MSDVTDVELERQLLSADAEKKDAFLAAVQAYKALHLDKTVWEPMKKRDDGSFTLPYPVYPDELFDVYDKLLDLTTPLPSQALDEQAVASAPIGYLIRYVSTRFRAERFVEGSVGRMVDDGSFDVALDRLTAALN